MAGKLRYWKEKDGRFYARIAVPKPLIPFIGKSELIEPLGGDRRAAIRKHPAAVARLQAEIVHAEQRAAQYGIGNIEAGRFALPPDQIAASHYAQRLEFDNELRNDVRYAQIGVDEGLAQRLSDAMAGRLTDAELFDLIGPRIERLRASGNLTAAPMTDEWRQIARALCVAEYEALSRVAERDEGDFTGKPTHPLLVNAKPPEEALPPVPLKTLFSEYIAIRQALGKHQDGAPGWQNALLHLIKFVGHSDARRVTKRNLLDWRDALLTEKKSPKTISDVYLASVRALLRWAFENDRLPTNEAETVRQEVPKKVQLRERGYTTQEALKVLEASLNYCPPITNNPANRESLPVTAAKRWVPLLCAFSGARVTEITQLRKEDVRQEGDRWVIRITPDAGSVKTGGYRDVPLHRQVVALGFINFVKAAKAGPLFHNKPKPEEYLAGARATSGRLSGWLQIAGLVPDNIQPNYGWRHRFKTQGRELGISDRIIDAIQRHAGRTASDNYGDVTLIARMRMIDALPDYELSSAPILQTSG